jgi:hypothetical protein
MTRSPSKPAPEQRPRTDRYFSAYVAQYIHELSERHAGERRAHDDASRLRPVLVGR